MTECTPLQVLDQVPIHDGRYVRASDIPEPYRGEFIADSRGSTMPLPEGETGACFFAHDYRQWLTYRRSPDYAPRFPKTCPADRHHE